MPERKSDIKRGCLRCPIVVALPGGRQVDGRLSVPLPPIGRESEIEQRVAEHLRRYQQLACEKFDGHCTVRIVEPFKLAQECG